MNTKLCLHLRYVLPESKYFSMAFPDPIRLAAGNAIHVDVVFRPVIYEPYDDVIEFICPTVRDYPLINVGQ